MDTGQLLELAQWYVATSPQVLVPYRTLRDALVHNTNNTPQQPIAPARNALTENLSAMDVDAFSTDKVALLRRLGVWEYLGKAGVKFIERTFEQNAHDVATTASAFSDAVAALEATQSRMATIAKGLSELEDSEIATSEVPPVTIRIVFQYNATISNVVDLKSWSDAWHDILRGIGLVLGEAPETYTVVGARRGSFILELGATYLAARLLAAIVHVALDVVSRVTSIQVERETLRAKRILNDVIEGELTKQIEQTRASALSKALEDVHKIVEPSDGEVETALTRSIRALLDFQEKGGEVDCIVSEGTTKDVEIATDSRAAREAVQQAVQENRRIVQELRRLKQIQSP